MIAGSMWTSPKVFPNIDGKEKVVWKFLTMTRKKIENITKVIMRSKIIKDNQEIEIRRQRSRNENVPDQGMSAREKNDHDQGNIMIENDQDHVSAIAIAKDRVQEIGIVKEKKDHGQGNITEKDLDQEIVIIIMEINMIEKDRDHVQEIGIANGIKDTTRVIENQEGIK